jgi:hypothetical protein
VTSVSPVVPATTGDVAVATSAAAAAQSTANTAQSTADGKNKIYRQGTTPTGTFAVGDTWFNTSSDNAISRWDGSSWVATTLGNNALASISANKITAGTIDASIITVSNLNAGNIATGTINSIAYNNGSGTFQVTSGGALTASSATITGTINATSGYLGSTSSGWNFSSSGYLYNSGSTTILYPTATPGGNASTYSIFTDRGVYAERIYSTGTQASSIYSLGGLFVNGQVSGAAGSFVVNSSGNMTTVGSITASGAITTSGNISTSGSATIVSGGAMTSGGTLRSGGNIEAAAMASLSATGVVWSSSNGRFYLTTSSERHKDNITPIVQADYLSKILQLQPVTFNYKPEFTDNSHQIISGLIAERVAEIPEFSTVINFDKDGLPESIAYDRLSVFMIPALKELNNRLLALEGK